VALVHDFVTQFGGGERTVLSMMAALPEAPLFTALYNPQATYPAFRHADVRTLPLNRIGPIRRNHRLALPVLAHSFSLSTVDADVAVCSSAGWAHGITVTGRKVVYCHTPARWLYGSTRYVQGGSIGLAAHAATLIRGSMKRWDRRAAASADRYLVNSSMVGDQVRLLYGVEAEVLPPPPTLSPDDPQHEVPGCQPGYLLCVSRFLPYKNVEAVVEAFALLPHRRLVVVGAGPYRTQVEASAPANVKFVGSVSDAQLRWLYAHGDGVVSAAYEDYGLTPLEAAVFAKPSVVLRWGGFLDTVVEGQTGLFFDEPEPQAIARAVKELDSAGLPASAIRTHADRFSFARFATRLQELVNEEARR
jgi:glycosyltransferase involved in cell wall biosynthesis